MQSIPGQPQFPSASSAPPGLIDKNDYNITSTESDNHNSLLPPIIDHQDQGALDLRKSNETVAFLSSSSSTSSIGSGSDRTTPISFTRANTNINSSSNQMETDRDRPSTSKNNTRSRYSSITQNHQYREMEQQFDCTNQQGQHNMEYREYEQLLMRSFLLQSTIDEVPPGNMCRSCRLPATGAIDTEGLGTFCSEVCFANFRLLNYRKKKICMMCQKVYPYLKKSENAKRAADNGDQKEIINGLLRVSRHEDVKFSLACEKFCSLACETQYRISWFKNETETHLELLKDTPLNGVSNFTQVVTGTGNQKPARKNDDLITPDLWTNEPFEERCIPASKNNGNFPLKRNHLQQQLKIMVNSNMNEPKMEVEQSASMKLSALGQYHQQEYNHLARSEVNNNSILSHHDLSHRSNTPAGTTPTTMKKFKAEKYQRRQQHQNYLEQLQKHKQKKNNCIKNNHLTEAENKIVNLKIRPNATATVMPNRPNHPNPNFNLEQTINNNKILQNHHKMIFTHNESERFDTFSRSSIEKERRNAQAHAEFSRQFAFQPHPMRLTSSSSSTSSPIPVPIPIHLPQRTTGPRPHPQFPIAFLLPVAIPIPFPGWNYNNNFRPRPNTDQDQGERGNIIEDFNTD